jgi:hypothetical protein
MLLLLQVAPPGTKSFRGRLTPLAVLLEVGVVSARLVRGCLCQCFIFSLSAVTFVFALVYLGVWLAGGDILSTEPSTLLAVVVFLASVGAGVMLVCAVFYANEKMTGPLFP